MDYQRNNYFTNKYRLKKIIEFRELYETYMNGISYSQYIGVQPIESEKSKKARENINKILQVVHGIMRNSGISTTGSFRQPSATYEYQDLDIILNIFSDDIIRSFSSNVKDAINQTIGIYENNVTNSILNTINPFYWIGRIAKKIVKNIIEPFGIQTSTKIDNIVALIANTVTIVLGIITLYSMISN